MAIKGKKRSRSPRRAPAAPPRPKLVEVKPPLVRRTWFRVTVIGVLVAGAAAGGLAGWAAKRAADERERIQQAVARAGVEIENALTFVGQPTPGAPGVLVLTELASALPQIQGGEAREKRIREDVEDWADRLSQSRDALEGIETDRRDLQRAIERILEGIGLYEELVADVPAALDIEGKKEREEYVVGLQSRLQEASSKVDEGWLIYTNERIDVGLDTGANPAFQPQLPTGPNPFAPPGPGEVPIPAPSG